MQGYATNTSGGCILIRFQQVLLDSVVVAVPVDNHVGKIAVLGKGPDCPIVRVLDNHLTKPGFSLPSLFRTGQQAGQALLDFLGFVFGQFDYYPARFFNLGKVDTVENVSSFFVFAF